MDLGRRPAPRYHRQIGALPAGRLVAVGHSGAHRTLAAWLDEPRLDTIALIDAAYKDLTVYRSWLAARSSRRFIDVGDVTRPMTDMFHNALPETVIVERFPPPEQGALPVEAWDARVVYVRSYMGHMRLVTGGVAIPMILRALDVPLVDDIDRAAPLVVTRSRYAGKGVATACVWWQRRGSAHGGYGSLAVPTPTNLPRSTVRIKRLLCQGGHRGGAQGQDRVRPVPCAKAGA